MLLQNLRRSLAMTAQPTSSPFTRAVVNAMRKLYPEELADKSWDNTGLTLEAPFTPRRPQKNSVLLTVDLTRAVADEAIRRKDSIIVAYHPIIFKGLKSITMENSQQQSLLRLAAEGISVYSPHTAVDAAAGGLGDWLADIVTGATTTASSTQSERESDRDASAIRSSSNSTAQEDPFQDKNRPVFMLQHHPSQAALQHADADNEVISHSRASIRALNNPAYPGAGMGRIVRFDRPQPLLAIIERIGRGLGNPKGFPIAIPQGASLSDITIRSIGICAGSGGSLFAGLDVDLLFTGELSHHEALAAIEKGQCVITLFHSNSERGFLHSVLRQQLLDQVRQEWDALRVQAREADDSDLRDVLQDDSVEVAVSEADRDPYGILVAESRN